MEGRKNGREGERRGLSRWHEARAQLTTAGTLEASLPRALASRVIFSAITFLFDKYVLGQLLPVMIFKAKNDKKVGRGKHQSEFLHLNIQDSSHSSLEARSYIFTVSCVHYKQFSVLIYFLSTVTFCFCHALISFPTF